MEINSSFYGKYRDVRSAAWRFLLEFQIASLPVDMMKVCEYLDVLIKPYSAVSGLLKSLSLTEFSKQSNGFTVYMNTQWYIFYRDDFFSFADINYTLAHELGHILLGHKMAIKTTPFQTAAYMAEKGKKDSIETQADMFAMRILAPSCVLKELHVHTYQEIMALCYLPTPYAKQRAKRLETLLQRDTFYKDPLELRVRDNFSDFFARKTVLST